jgi:hypothetical protein
VRLAGARRAGATWAAAGFVNWMQQRWTTQWTEPGMLPGWSGCRGESPCPCAGWDAGELAATTHPGMVPHVIALSAKHAATAAESRERIMG